MNIHFRHGVRRRQTTLRVIPRPKASDGGLRGAGALVAVPMHLISVTDLPEVDSEGHIVRPSAVRVEKAPPTEGKSLV